MDKTFTYEVTKAHRHSNQYGRHDHKVHSIPVGPQTRVTEIGTAYHAHSALSYAHSACNKCIWENNSTVSNRPLGRCKNCSIIWIWDKSHTPARTARQINENGKKIGDTVWVNKLTGEPHNCLDCGSQLIRTSRGHNNIRMHTYKPII